MHKNPHQLRLLSYNIHKGIGGRDRRYRLERIVSVIEREEPDLILLQEVDRNVRRSRFDDQPRLFREQFGVAAHCYQMNVHLKTGGYGNLLLSRWPLAEHHHLSPRFKRKKPRGAQLVVVETPQGPLRLVNWHLGLGERERHWQVDHLLRHHTFRDLAGLPTLLAGDFNDWRNTLAAGAMADHGLHQATAPISRFRSFPAYLPLGSLDKAFYCDLKLEHARVAHTDLARRASDHRPLIVDFHLK